MILGNRGLRVVLTRHFCTSPNVRHARRKQADIELHEYLPKAHIKRNKQTKTATSNLVRQTKLMEDPLDLIKIE